MHPNHRANDIIVVENTAFKIAGKFVYGPIEVAALTGEKVEFSYYFQLFSYIFAYCRILQLVTL